MKSFALLALVLTTSVFSCYSQESDAATRVTDDARFEMVQIPWDKATTFHLDKYRGTIHRLGTCTKDDAVGSNRCWKEMIVVDLASGAVSSRPRYQIVVNAMLKNVFLLDVNTGQTWQYALDAT